MKFSNIYLEANLHRLFPSFTESGKRGISLCVKIPNEILYAIWYHSYNFKNVDKTHREVLLLAKLQGKACNFTKSNTPPWMFSRFLNCANGTKSRKAPQILFFVLISNNNIRKVPSAMKVNCYLKAHL